MSQLGIFCTAQNNSPNISQPNVSHHETAFDIEETLHSQQIETALPKQDVCFEKQHEEQTTYDGQHFGDSELQNKDINRIDDHNLQSQIGLLPHPNISSDLQQLTSNKQNMYCPSSSSRFHQMKNILTDSTLDDLNMNQTLSFVTFEERPRSESLRIPNLSINCEKKSFDNKLYLQNKIATNSSSNSDTTLFRSDLQKQKILSPTIEVAEYLHLLSTDELIYEEQQTNKNNNNNIIPSLIKNNESIIEQKCINSYSMEDDTSSLSSSIPLKKKKKAICKNNNSPSSNNSLPNSSKGTNPAHRKKSQTINTSQFFTSQKRECNISQQQIETINKSQFNPNDTHEGLIHLNNDYDIVKDTQNNYDKDIISNINNNYTDEKTNNNNNQSNGNSKVSKENKTKMADKMKQQNNLLDQQFQSKKIRFTQEEDAALMNLIAVHGKKWKLISELMDGKNETRIRNRYYSYIRKVVKPGDSSSISPIAFQETSQENNFNQINGQQSISEQNPESFQQESVGNSHLLNVEQTNNVKSASITKLKHINGHLNEKQDTSFNLITQLDCTNSDRKQGENIQFNQSQLQQQQQQQQQQSTQYVPFFNSTLFDSLNILTLNNFDKEFNGIAMYDGNNFQSNFHDSVLVQSTQNLQQNPFSSNNLNFDYLNQIQNNKMPSFKFLNRFEGSLVNLDHKAGHNQYFNNNKNSIQEFEAIDAEEYNQKYYQNDNINKNNNHIFSSVAIIQEDEHIIEEQQHNYQNQQSNNQTIQSFCPNKILKPYQDFPHQYDEPSPLILAKAAQRYDPKRFLTSNIQQTGTAFNSQNPISRFSMDEEMLEENQNDKPKSFHQNEDTYYVNLSDREKMQKIVFLNTQVENISTMIEQCKQEILNEILTKVKKNA